MKYKIIHSMYVCIWLQQMWHIINDYYLKNTPESVTEYIFFKDFLGDAPKPPSCSMLCMFGCVLRTHFQIHLLCLPFYYKAAELGHTTQNYLAPPLHLKKNPRYTLNCNVLEHEIIGVYVAVQ